MKLFEYLNEKELREMMDAGYINMQMHPSAPLYIYNYSKMCQIDRMWNDTTEKCRGLIVDSNDNIVSRPFRKFYNYEEYEDPSVIGNSQTITMKNVREVSSSINTGKFFIKAKHYNSNMPYEVTITYKK